jgi:hypothetical protein
MACTASLTKRSTRTQPRPISCVLSPEKTQHKPTSKPAPAVSIHPASPSSSSPRTISHQTRHPGRRALPLANTSRFPAKLPPSGPRRTATPLNVAKPQTRASGSLGHGLDAQLQWYRRAWHQDRSAPLLFFACKVRIAPLESQSCFPTSVLACACHSAHGAREGTLSLRLTCPPKLRER